MIISWIVLIVVVDQWTKSLAIKHLKNKGKKETKLLVLRYVENYGAAMGFLKRWPVLLKSLSVVLLIAVAGVLVNYKINMESDLLIFALATVIGGGIGNVMDRFTRGYVVDFYSPKIKKLPYFNIADFFVILGSVLLVVSELNV